MEAIELSQSRLNEIAVSRIIERAKGFSNDPELTREQIYDSSKRAIRHFTETSEEYERAIRRLAEALNI
jgi:hypothetical protein